MKIMKKIIRDPQIYFLLGLLGLIIAIPTNNLYINIILIPIFILMQIIGIIFMIKKYMNEKKVVKQEGKDVTDHSYKKPDISTWTSLLALFSSLFAVVSSIVMLVFLNKGYMELFQYFIIVTSCIHVVIVSVSSVAFYKILANKKKSS